VPQMDSLSFFSMIDKLRFFDALRFNAKHYNAITDAWRYIFGDNFHFGYFAAPTTSLDDATNALIDKLASLADISQETKILDVGCGIGTPAFYLHKKTACDITGISTSETGIGRAQQESIKRGFEQKVRFRVADGLNTGFAPETFDIAWVMESSHLMRDKKGLFAECWRVLKPGGVVLLCDVMMRRPYTLADRLELLKAEKLNLIIGSIDNIKSFGWVRLETFETYTRGATDAGFKQVELVDISEQVMPTFEGWKANILAREESVLKTLNRSQINSFINGSEFCKTFFKNKISGYGIVKASKSK
jgi:27-O-demethylrifamycin SV methyltransferase